MKRKELTKWREDRGITKASLAGYLGVAEMTIYRWERGDRKIPSFLGLALKEIERKLKGKGE